MDREQAEKLRERLGKLRTLEARGATADERASAKASADRLQARLEREAPARGVFEFTTPPYVHGYERHAETNLADLIAQWYRDNPPPDTSPQREAAYPNANYTEEDIVEEGYRYDDEDGDW